jgi:hypothetical protein
MPARSRVRPPLARIIRITWGLSTCYHTIGVAPADDWYFGAEAIATWTGADVQETIEAQREEMNFGIGIAGSLVAEFVAKVDWRHRRRISHSGGNSSIGAESYHYVYVTGTRQERVSTMAAMDAAHHQWSASRIQMAMDATRQACGVREPQHD